MSPAATLVRSPIKPDWAQDHDAEVYDRVSAERLRIARELHDVVSHGFAAIGIQAGAAEHLLETRPEQAAEALRAIKAASKEALVELREILGMLRQGDDGGRVGPGLGLDGIESLASTVTSAGVPTTIQVSGSPRPLPPNLERAAYRTVQEALTNVLRHAGAASATVSILFKPDQLVVEVQDDGPGSGAPSEGSGHGLLGMRERAAAVGGELRAGPRPEGGFHVRATFPLGLR